MLEGACCADCLPLLLGLVPAAPSPADPALLSSALLELTADWVSLAEEAQEAEAEALLAVLPVLAVRR